MTTNNNIIRNSRHHDSRLNNNLRGVHNVNAQLYNSLDKYQPVLKSAGKNNSGQKNDPVMMPC